MKIVVADTILRLHGGQTTAVSSTITMTKYVHD